MDIQYGNLANLNYLWLVVGVAAAFGFAAVARRRALGKFATPNLINAIFDRRHLYRPWLQAALTMASLTALVLTLTDIRWGKTWREVPQKGIEVVFALDVSRSMLAEDVAPNRLGRAKQQIKDMVDELQGDRVGLVVFAGDAKRKIPLTTHYDDFKRILDEVGPHDISHGGSSLGGAIRVASDSFLAKTSDHKAIVLFTDGEDHESKPVAAAIQAHAENGVRVFTVGLGDDRQGARVPVQTARRGYGYLEHGGEQVWSKLDGSILKEIAVSTEGAYVPAGTKQVDMSRVYRDYVAHVEQQDFETARINGYVPRFQWFLGTALLLALAESLLRIASSRTVREKTVFFQTPNAGSPKSRRALKIPVAAAVAMMTLFLGAAKPTPAADADAYALAQQGTQAMQEGKYDEAAERFRQATEIAPEMHELQYDQAIALYRKGDLDSARHLFTAATASADRLLESKARFNLGNCDYAEALKLSKEDRTAAKEKARAAISHYRGSLAANPNDGDARANVELASLLIRRLDEQEKLEQQKQDQHQDQDNKQNDQQGKVKNQDQQNKPEDQGQSDEKSSDSSSQNETSSKGAENQSAKVNSEDSRENGESTKDNQAQPGSQGQQSEQDQTNDASSAKAGDRSDEVRDSANKQSNSGENSEEQKSAEESQPTDSQQNATGEESDIQSASSDKQSRSATGERGEPKPASPEPSSNDAAGEIPQGELESTNTDNSKPTADAAVAGQINDSMKPMTRQEAMKMLQAVRDRDLMRRIQNQRKSQRRYIPGDKDW